MKASSALHMYFVVLVEFDFVVAKLVLIELRLKVQVNNISAMSGLHPERTRENRPG